MGLLHQVSWRFQWLAVLASVVAGGCSSSSKGDADAMEVERSDGATLVAIDGTGSLQNPAFSPGSDRLLVTRFTAGYNREPADLLVTGVDGSGTRTLVSDGSGNVNLPGSSWNRATGLITFSSSREPHDEIFVIDAGGAPGSERSVTARDSLVAFEPSFSPDGDRVVFETHVLDVEGGGVIETHRVGGGGGYVSLTAAGDDARQPNWAPDGEHILYQRFTAGQWDLWIMDSDGANARQLTSGPGDKTDASFSPDSQWIVYSSDEGGLDSANLFVIAASGGPSTRVTRFSGYDGAPSWSPDGALIAFESYPGDPDDSPGTIIRTIGAPAP